MSLMMDIDGVVADYVRGFTQQARVLYMGGERIKVEGTWEHKSWGFDMPKEAEDLTYDYIRAHPEWWGSLLALPSSLAMEKLKNINDNITHVYFVTHRPENTEAITANWLERHIHIRYPSVVATKNKGEFARLVGVTHALDDKIENAWMVHWMADNPQVKSCLVNRIYNNLVTDLTVGPKKVIRFDTILEFLDLVEEDYGASRTR